MAHIISFVAGKSGGHIIPCLSVAKKEKIKNPDAKILFFATTKALDQTILQQHPYIDYLIYLPALSIPAKKWLYPLFCISLCFAFIKAFIWLVRLKPLSLVSMGELISVPVCYAARLLRIPITLYELNATPGKTVMWLAPLAHHIHVCFPHAASFFSPAKISHVPYPLRFTGQEMPGRIDALHALQLHSDRKTILIIGGSQGSLTLDTIMHTWILQHSHTHGTLQIIHQTHAQRGIQVKHTYTTLGIPSFVFDYYNAMELCYMAADVVVCRAGAGTLFEVLFFKKRCITIPLETVATSHQYDNAVQVAAQQTALVTVLRQKEVTHDNILLHEALTRYLD
jgi:UDP-N-acetylglucosamine--N-acetylmuramyl-(pentapeptide) pyrophosphoryl-undecaprenol N-acetylglucosamine transferase